ncbi:uncharacterized protein LOC131954402 isoform X2 [Physella acuta]|uniref:uncharacterized protein LOC131954402 isoform X2 n=1 Tax=Physella acuta TaxID=109671 RepID=UPI0027DE166C|nr:uncharacterized protein LOC131954402 isoform X2 [Physella acuta]
MDEAADVSALPVDFEGSLDPGGLPEVTLGNHSYLASGDQSSPMLTKSNSGRMSPVRGRTMKEYDQQISDLKKENFSLKMRIYYMEERMQQRYGDGQDVFKTNIELQVEIENLKRDLMDKQLLVQKAAVAMKTLTDNHEQTVETMRNRVLSENKEEMTRLRDMAEKAYKDCEKSRKEAEEATKKLEQLKQALEDTRAELGSTSRAKEELANKVKSAEFDVKTLMSQLKLSEQARSEQDKEKTTLLTRQKELELQLQDARKETSRKERDIMSLSNYLQNQSHVDSTSILEPVHLQDEMDDQKEALERQEAKLKDQQGLLKHKDDLITTLEDALRKMEAKKDEADNKLEEKIAELDQKCIVLERYKKSVEGLVRSVRDKEKECKNCQKKLEEAVKELNSLREALRAAELEKTKAVNQLAESEDSKQRVQHQLDEANSVAENLIMSLGKKEGELAGFQDQLHRAMDALNKSEEAVEALQAQLNAERADFDQRLKEQALMFQKSPRKSETGHEMEALRRQIADLQKLISDQNAELLAFARNKGEVNNLTEALKSRDEDIQQLSDLHKKEIAALKKELEALKADMSGPEAKTRNKPDHWDSESVHMWSDTVNKLELHLDLPQGLFQDMKRMMEMLSQDISALASMHDLKDSAKNRDENTSKLLHKEISSVQKIYRKLEDGVEKNRQLHSALLASLKRDQRQSDSPDSNSCQDGGYNLGSTNHPAKAESPGLLNNVASISSKSWSSTAIESGPQSPMSRESGPQSPLSRESSLRSPIRQNGLRSPVNRHSIGVETCPDVADRSLQTSVMYPNIDQWVQTSPRPGHNPEMTGVGRDLESLLDHTSARPVRDCSTSAHPSRDFAATDVLDIDSVYASLPPRHGSAKKVTLTFPRHGTQSPDTHNHSLTDDAKGKQQDSLEDYLDFRQGVSFDDHHFEMRRHDRASSARADSLSYTPSPTSTDVSLPSASVSPSKDSCSSASVVSKGQSKAVSSDLRLSYDRLSDADSGGDHFEADADGNGYSHGYRFGVNLISLDDVDSGTSYKKLPSQGTVAELGPGVTNVTCLAGGGDCGQKGEVTSMNNLAQHSQLGKDKNAVNSCNQSREEEQRDLLDDSSQTVTRSRRNSWADELEQYRVNQPSSDASDLKNLVGRLQNKLQQQNQELRQRLSGDLSEQTADEGDLEDKMSLGRNHVKRTMAPAKEETRSNLTGPVKAIAGFDSSQTLALELKIKELEDKLEATENTVRLLSKKTKSYKSALEAAGISTAALSRSSSETCLTDVTRTSRRSTSMRNLMDWDNDDDNGHSCGQILSKSCEKVQASGQARQTGLDANQRQVDSDSSSVHSTSAELSVDGSHQLDRPPTTDLGGRNQAGSRHDVPDKKLDYLISPNKNRFDGKAFLKEGHEPVELTRFTNLSRSFNVTSPPVKVLATPSTTSVLSPDSTTKTIEIYGLDLQSTNCLHTSEYNNLNQPTTDGLSSAPESRNIEQKFTSPDGNNKYKADDESVQDQTQDFRSPGRGEGHSKVNVDTTLVDQSLYPDVTYHSMLDSTLLTKHIFNISTFREDNSEVSKLSVDQLKMRVEHLEQMNITLREEISVFEALHRSTGTQVSLSLGEDHKTHLSNEDLLQQHLVEIRKLRQRLERLDVTKDPEQLLIFQSHTHQRIARQDAMITQLQQQMVERETNWHRDLAETQHKMAREKALAVEKLEQTIAQLQKTINSHAVTIENQEVMIQDLRKELEQKERSERKREEDVKKVVAEKQTLEEDLMKREKEFLEMEKLMFKLEMSKENSESECKGVMVELEAKVKDVQRLHKEVEEYEESCRCLKEIIVKKDKTLQERSHLVQRLTGEKNAMETKLSEKENGVKQLEQELDKLRKEMHVLTSVLDEKVELQATVKKLQEQVKEKERSVEKLGAEKASSVAEVKRVQQERVSMRQRLEETEAEKVRLGQQVEQLQRQVREKSGLESQVSSLKTKVQSLTAEMDQLSSVVDSKVALEAELKEHIKAMSSLQQEAGGLREQLAKAESSVQKLEQEKQRVEESLREREEKVKKRDKQLHHLLGQYKKLDTAFTKLKYSHKEKVELTQSLRKQMHLYEVTLTCSSQEEKEDVMKELLKELMATQRQVEDLLSRLEQNSEENKLSAESTNIFTTTTKTSSVTETHTVYSGTKDDGLETMNDLYYNVADLDQDNVLAAIPTNQLSPHRHVTQNTPTPLQQQSPRRLKNSTDNMYKVPSDLIPQGYLGADILKLFAVLKLDIFEKLRKETNECLVTLSGVEARLSNRLKVYKAKPASESVDYSTMRETSMSCHNMRICLVEAARLVGTAWITELPPLDSQGHFYDPVLTEQNGTLKQELTKLRAQYDVLNHTVQEQQGRLTANTERHKNWEASLYKQLYKTTRDLEQAKENIDTSLAAFPPPPRHQSFRHHQSPQKSPHKRFEDTI